VLIGVFSILCYYLNWKIDVLFVTATLTVIGFSVHNTVVIFDRIRENLRNRVRGESFEHLVNHSTLQTMDRSIRTSGTVLMTLLALLIFGGETTRALNLALFIGVLSGTYSAIFNASAILVDWENWLAKRRAAAAATAGTSPSTARPVAATASANGGSPRAMKASREPVVQGSLTHDSESDEQRIKPKKKKPARRF
jgi:preprotein translocase subunit SecF